jgi:hypothetical protein
VSTIVSVSVDWIVAVGVDSADSGKRAKQSTRLR